jgi:large subunit ribosomal protein L4
LNALGLKGLSTLVTLDRHDPNVVKSARNIQRVSISPVEGLNALAVLTPRRMLVTKAALDRILGRSTTGAA